MQGTRERLLATAALHLTHPDFAPLVSELHGMSNRLLLVGTFGSDLYQEQLVTCMARQLKARLVAFDRKLLGLQDLQEAVAAGQEDPRGATDPDGNPLDDGEQQAGPPGGVASVHTCWLPAFACRGAACLKFPPFAVI